MPSAMAFQRRLQAAPNAKNRRTFLSGGALGSNIVGGANPGGIPWVPWSAPAASMMIKGG